MRPLWLCTLGIALILGSISGFAGHRQWTEAERACAEALSVPSGRGLARADPLWLEYLAWSSQIAVVGKVESIHEDLFGPYHTLVTIAVEDYWKGSGADSLVVALRSGPVYIEELGKVGRVSLGHPEPTFFEGETIVLFLDKNFLEPIVDDMRYALAHDQWRVNGAKFELQQDSVFESKLPHRKWTVEEFRARANRIIEGQAGQCSDLNPSGVEPPEPTAPAPAR